MLVGVGHHWKAVLPVCGADDDHGPSVGNTVHKGEQSGHDGGVDLVGAALACGARRDQPVQLVQEDDGRRQPGSLQVGKTCWMHWRSLRTSIPMKGSAPGCAFDRAHLLEEKPQRALRLS